MELENLKKANTGRLQKLCAERGLPVTMDRQQMIDDLLQFESGAQLSLS